MWTVRRFCQEIGKLLGYKAHGQVLKEVDDRARQLLVDAPALRGCYARGLPVSMFLACQELTSASRPPAAAPLVQASFRSMDEDYDDMILFDVDDWRPELVECSDDDSFAFGGSRREWRRLQRGHTGTYGRCGITRKQKRQEHDRRRRSRQRVVWDEVAASA